MAADVPTPRVAESSVAMVFAAWVECILVFHEEGFLLYAPSQCRKIIAQIWIYVYLKQFHLHGIKF